MSRLVIRPGAPGYRELISMLGVPLGSEVLVRHGLVMGTLLGRWLFKPRSLQREIAVQASGNLVAAYFILIAACFVGLGDYTADVRYWVIVLTGALAGAGLALGIATYVHRLLIMAARSALAGVTPTDNGRFIIRMVRELAALLGLIIALGAFVGLIYLLREPVSELVGRTP